LSPAAESDDPGSVLASDFGTFVPDGTPCISSSTNVTSEPDFHCRWGGVASTIMHNPTGLFVYGGWGQITTTTDHVFPAGTVFLSTSNMFFLQRGIERKWNSLGKTNIYGEYRRDDSGSAAGRTVSANVDTWQAGVIQRIDNADVLGNARTAAANFAPIGKADLKPFQILSRAPRSTSEPTGAIALEFSRTGSIGCGVSQLPHRESPWPPPFASRRAPRAAFTSAT
jgi:hypothetical protein